MGRGFAKLGRLPTYRDKEDQAAALVFAGVLDLVDAELRIGCWTAGGVGDQPDDLWDIAIIAQRSIAEWRRNPPRRS